MEELNLVSLLQAAQKLEQKVSVSLMYSGLRMAQFRLLSAIENSDNATVTSLSKTLNNTRATTSVLVNEMVRAGALVMEDNPNDRRSFHIALTDLGRNKLHVARSDLAVLQRKLSTRFEADMIEVLNRFADGVTGQAS